MSTNIGPSGLGPFPFNAGIAVTEGMSNAFTNNTFSASPTASATNYYGIGLNEFWLSVDAKTNINNFISNSFAPSGLGAYAEGYPLTNTAPPNSWTTNEITNNIMANGYNNW